jgi:hypothetical protein
MPYLSGITSYSSNLYYAYQPGGLNEGYSDIMGTVIEYYINDSIDTPDFTLGESLGDTVLRDMENPPRDGSSIDHACDYQNDRTVHHTSGVLNKAFVKSVRVCEDSACSDERGCVLLLGPLFMYANIQKLTQLSGYLDSATKTCKVVEEFFSTKKPNTMCTASQTIQFVKDGWSQVGLVLDDDCTGSIPECELSATPQIEGLPDGGGGGTENDEEEEDDGCSLFSLIRWPFEATFNAIRLPFSWLFGDEDEAAESSINGAIDPSQGEQTAWNK